MWNKRYRKQQLSRAIGSSVKVYGVIAIPLSPSWLYVPAGLEDVVGQAKRGAKFSRQTRRGPEKSSVPQGRALKRVSMRFRQGETRLRTQVCISKRSKQIKHLAKEQR